MSETNLNKFELEEFPACSFKIVQNDLVYLAFRHTSWQ